LILNEITKGRISVRAVILAALVLGAPAGAWAGFSAQGFSAQGFSAQGFSAQGFSAQGFSAQGFSAQGFSAQGFSAQGFSAQGFSAQGFSAQGFSAQGVALLGTDVVASDIKGVDIGSVDIRGTTSDSGPVAIELTANPTMSTGAGTYISVGGGSAVGHFATAHLVDANGNPAEDLDLYIARERPDPVPNELHRAASQANDDITLYEIFFFQPASGQWASLCPFHDVTGAATAMAIPEDPATPGKFIFACTATGVAAKCARIWGYRPWRHDTTWFFDDTINDWVEKDFDMKPFYDACKTAARAGYCQDRQSFTRNGTFVDLFDTRQFVWPNAIQNPLSALNPDSLWMFAQEYFVTFTPLMSDPSLKVTALQRTRWRDLSPVGQCASFADIDRLEEDHFEDARFANPLTADPRVEIFSPNYCQHNEAEIGTALPWDCSPCTTAVCRKFPHCCSADPTLPQPVWDASCVADRNDLCQDVPGGTGPWWPLGKVWPRDAAPPTAPQKYLIGPGGAVETTAGVSTGGTSATIQGWACDPEWPGTAVPVAIYGGAPREHGGALLGTIYADEALAAPLAGEVGTTCDGLGHASARHGFSFTLPLATKGNVFAYALDTETPDGPAAPPTLLRNGIVHVPTCDHSEHLAGTALASSCSTCAASVCAKGGLGGCCATAWTDDCAAAAEACEPADTSAAADGRTFGQVLTGWIEAPTTGTYVFSAASQPSRVTVNGQKVVDWFAGPGPTSGSVDLQQGGRYYLRWDRFQAAPPATGTDPGLTWQPPGALAQQTIPSGNLYRVVPGEGTGLRATYFDNPGLTGASAARLDAAVEQSATTVLPAGVLPPTYSILWEGEIVPLYSDTYEFTLLAAGDAHLEIGSATIVAPVPVGPPLTGCAPHDICALGDKLTASTITQSACDPCVDSICAKDPFCCDGGYLSYYSTEPVWDAKCVTEVGTVCGLTCKNPLPSPTTQARPGTPIPLQSGVRYRVRATVDVTTSDNTVQLIWASPRQPRGPVPTMVLYPAVAPSASGAGLNLVMVATKNGGTEADLTTPLASGATPDLSLAPPVGPNGLPLVNVLAPTSDGAAGTPPPPVLEQPRPGGQVYNAATSIHVSGMGGVLGGSVLAHVQGTGTDVVLSVAGDGTYAGDIPVAAYGTYTLRLTQRSYPGASCVAPPAAFCADSTSVDWQVTVSALAPASPPPPVITSPRDPTASPNPANDTFPVTGTATPGAVNVCDEGTGTTLTSTVTAAGNGAINDHVQLSAGSPAAPAQGWHKLVFTTAACTPPIVGGSNPVYVSVGIRPPTVEFPRTGAEIDCSLNAPPNPGVFDVKGTIPYAEASFGRLRIAEETGRAPLQLLGRDVVVDQTPLPDGSFTFHTSLNLPPGKHLIYFFQAPDPPTNATPDDVVAHFRAYANVAGTPKSRIELHVPPPRLQLPFRGQTFVTSGTLKFGEGNCDPANGANGPDCALPDADVNIHVGNRVWTTRANDNGNWSLSFDLPPGWHQMKISQVVDSRVGGGWQEGCPSDDTLVGVTTGNGNLPTLTLPGPITVPADGPSGTIVSYAASATTAAGTPAQLDCTPVSGTLFHVGPTLVLCTAIDPATQAVGLGGFGVLVVDGPPVVTVPGPITAEAQSALGALVSFDASATDVVSGALPVDCVPASPALFSLDETTTVTCQATDGAGNTTSASFPVTVVDTTPPSLCPLPNLRVLAAGPSGGAVTYATCATDLVDGADPVTCNHPSGSFFPVGTTIVTCASTDRHGNTSPPAHFAVVVGDSTPPVLHLPATIQVTAASRLGTRVSYSVTAKDDTDPHPVVSCAPASGSLFPLGDTTVHCSATDASGNRATSSFLVRVRVSFGGFLPPINNNGTSVFLRPIPVLVRFALADGSAGIRDLVVRLTDARIDAAGNVGVEHPAAGLPPVIGNTFVYNPLLREYDLLMDIHAMAAGPWQLRADLGDGAAHTVRITLR
jgi:hypothetical protein